MLPYLGRADFQEYREWKPVFRPRPAPPVRKVLVLTEGERERVVRRILDHYKTTKGAK